ncbi:tigger transposable element-derived protein 1-like [Centruroides sculpturatus]|uniref:tigger transposable element-derived protein 1-like n=1 Tax=Centruroides sculpturatus TaxID=218467 RepID=UPI000C6E9F34|nr:tigger transposable element-derived protein 1-like [Centruroides sculpturatus]
MVPKKEKSDSENTKRFSVALKKVIIAKYENGIRVSDIAKEYNVAKSTISTIIKNKKAFKTAEVAKGVNVISKQRSKVLDKVEKLLLIWINEKQLAGDSVSEAIICEKAKNLYNDLLIQTPSPSADRQDFKARRGWFDKFRRRTGIHSVIRHGEASSSNEKATKAFVDEFAEFVKSEGYVWNQVFNCDETGLFWKRMPRRTYITQEEKALSGPMKDRLTLLFCANARGDLKIKPLLVYSAENIRVFKSKNVIKSKLPIQWKANSKHGKWIFLLCLLLMDNAPAHPPNLEDDLDSEHDFVKVKFFPPNTTPLLQPMDQQVTNDTDLNLRTFWKEHFNILHCINLIDKAWSEVSHRTLQSPWRKLWPTCVPERNFKEFEEESSPDVVHEIVSIGKSLRVEVDDADVEELLKDQ